MIENRKTVRRWELLLFLPLVNVETEEVIGRIADITTDGVMIFSDHSLQLGQLYTLKIRREDLMETLLDRDIAGETVEFQAQVRWLDEQPPLYRVGLQFVNIDDQAYGAIRHIVRNVARNLES